MVNAGEAAKANMASAAVALGLAPTLFIFIGSTMDAIALLPRRRIVTRS